MAEMKLYKQDGTYKDKQSGEDKRFTRFYLQLGSTMIPIEPCYFPQDRFDGRDPQFAGRKEVLRAFAEPLPPKDSVEG